MINDSQKLLQHLQAVAGITALTTTARIWAEEDYPPPDYNPGQGQALVFKRRGGGEDHEGAILKPNYLFKCYGQTPSAANALYRALYDGLHQQASQYIKYAIQDQPGETVREIDTRWPYVLVFYTILVANF